MNTPQLALPTQNASVGLHGRVATAFSSTTGKRASFSSFQDELAAQSSADAEPDCFANTIELQGGAKASGLLRSQLALRLSAVLGKPNTAETTPALPQSKATSDGIAPANEPSLNVNGRPAEAFKALCAGTKAPLLKTAADTTTANEVRSFKSASTRNRAVQAPDESGTAQTSLTNQPGSVKTDTGDTSRLSEEANPAQHSRTVELAETKSVDPSDKVNLANPVSGELAMAMQIKSGSQEKGSLHSEAEEGASEDEKVVSNAGTHGPLLAFEPQQGEHRSAEVPQIISSVTDSHAQQASGQTEKQVEAGEARPIDAADFHAEIEKAQSEPVRGAHVQIAGENNEKVDIRLFERGGALSVTVRSGDTNLNRALQDHIPELTSRLSLDHFRTETWTPNASRTGEQQSPNSGSFSRQGHSTQDGQNPNGRQGKQNQQQPDWIDELEAQPVPFFRKG